MLTNSTKNHYGTKRYSKNILFRTQLRISVPPPLPKSVQDMHPTLNGLATSIYDNEVRFVLVNIPGMSLLSDLWS